MTVSQTYEILWEPDEPAEAVAGAIALLRVDGLELTSSGRRSCSGSPTARSTRTRPSPISSLIYRE